MIFYCKWCYGKKFEPPWQVGMWDTEGELLCPISKAVLEVTIQYEGNEYSFYGTAQERQIQILAFFKNIERKKKLEAL